MPRSETRENPLETFMDVTQNVIDGQICEVDILDTGQQIDWNERQIKANGNTPVLLSIKRSRLSRGMGDLPATTCAHNATCLVTAS